MPIHVDPECRIDSDIHQVFLEAKVFFRTGRWRLLTPRKSGEVNGIPTSRGLAIATDGMLVLIRQSDGSLFEGHLEWFEKDQLERERREKMDATLERLLEDL